MKLSQYAKKLGISYKTAIRHYHKGFIKGYQLPTGTIIVENFDSLPKKEHVVIYSRVSSSENRSNLETQAQRVSDFCTARGWIVNETVKECASGLNDNRPKLLKIFKDRKATRIVVEHSDRLTRFGFNYIKTLMPECEIVVINESKNDQEDLMKDFVSLVTSFCARLYGQRRSRRATEKIIREMAKE
jgi:predicted site-specific integrase-resolvase